MLGKVKIADMLARAGIHIDKTTVGRILKEKPVNVPDPTTDDSGRQCRIVSKYPSHTWHADLTAVPISGGFWTNWIPNALWQQWPVCWWLLNVMLALSSNGTTSGVPMTRSGEGRRMKCTSRMHQRTNNLVLSLVETGHVDPRAQSRKSILTVIPEIPSSLRSTARRAVAISPWSR